MRDKVLNSKISKLRRTEMSYMDYSTTSILIRKDLDIRGYNLYNCQQHWGKDFKPLYPDKFTQYRGAKDILEKLGKQFIDRRFKKIVNN